MGYDDAPKGDRAVLIDRRNFWKLHGPWLVGTVLAALAALAWCLAARSAAGHWPGGGSWPGLSLGTVAALVILFELALVAKKSRWLRTARWSLSAQTWMKAHLWLGLLTVPLVALHCGLSLGGALTTLLTAAFALVIVSGLWGLALQNLLPRMLLEAAPAETIYSEIDSVGRQYADEARRLISLQCGLPDTDGAGMSNALGEAATAAAGKHVSGAPRVVGPPQRRSPQPVQELARTIPSPAVQDAASRDILSFLETGRLDSGLLGSRQRNQWYFDDLRLRVPPELRGLVGQLESLCEQRRQLNIQRRLHFWLHNWLWLHLPLSIALVALLAGHVLFALRYG